MGEGAGEHKREGVCVCFCVCLCVCLYGLCLSVLVVRAVEHAHA